VYSIPGVGAGFAGSKDQLRFVYWIRRDDFELTARLEGLVDPRSAYTGLMLRESLDPDSRAVTTLGSASSTYTFVRYRAWSGIPVHVPGAYQRDPNAVAPYWLKMIRHGDQISIYTSADRSRWNYVDGESLTNLSSEVYVGLYVASQHAKQLATARYAQVSFASPVPLAYRTSWIGNSLPGGSTHVPMNVGGMYVDPSTGRVYTNTFFDEGGIEAAIFLPDGTMYGSLEETHEPFYGGDAITSNGTYVFMAMKRTGAGLPQGKAQFGVRRYDMNGTRAPVAGVGGLELDHTMRVINEVDGNAPIDYAVHGLAFTNNRLFVSDTANGVIKVFDSNLRKVSDPNLRSDPDFSFFSVAPATHPRGMTADLSGNLWIIVDDGGAPKVRKYSRSGASLGVEITAVAKPSSVTATPHGEIWITDDGPDQQIRKFDPGGNAVGTIGWKGGIFGDPAGLVDASGLKFNGPRASGMDRDGNVYVACDPGSGTELRKFDSSMALQWARYGLEFTGVGDFDPRTDGQDVYTCESHYSIDYSQPPGRQWTYKGMTVDWRDPNAGFARDDMRRHLKETSASGGMFVRRVQGRKLLFMTLMHAQMLAVYRFAGNEIAIPAALLMRGGDGLTWPYGQPSCPRWIWYDVDEDGHIEPGAWDCDPNNPDYLQKAEFRKDTHATFGDTPPLLDSWGWYVDSDGDVWVANSVKRTELLSETQIRQYKPYFASQSSTVPEYRLFKAYPAPGEMQMPAWRKSVMRAHYVPSQNAMFLSGYDPNHPHCDPRDPNNPTHPCYPGGEAGRVLYRYDNWTETPSKAWGPVVLPYAAGKVYSLVAHVAASISVAGNRVYVAMADTRNVLVFDATTGAALPSQELIPGPEVSGKSGLVDVGVGLNAFQRQNGDYLVLEEDDGYAKNLLYHP
jgi:hypothetical protein